MNNKITNSTICITGGAGFIGSYVIEELLLNYQPKKIIILDNLIRGSFENMRSFIDNPIIDFMLVAGGGSGGSSTGGNSAGGGGAGGLIYTQNQIITLGVKPIVIGNGGAVQSVLGNKGKDSCELVTCIALFVAALDVLP
jgi:hypothetical protein